MLQVSSDSKFTMDSPPFASSALFGGRKRATTGEKESVSVFINRNDSSRWLTLDGVASIASGPKRRLR